MSKRRWGILCGGLAVAWSCAAPPLRAQYAKPPETYTVTQVNSMMGASSTMKVYRDGSKAVIEHLDSNPPMREYVDLVARKTVSWSLKDASNTCGSGTFSGDWGDPFVGSAELSGELAQQHATTVGSETVNGFATKLNEAALPDGQGKARAWVETKYGLLIKLEMGGKPFLETKEASFAKPPASVFAIPAACSGALSAPTPPTEAERIAAETGGQPGEFSNAIMAQASPNACTVLLRVMQAGSMQPITGGFQLAIDKTINPENMPPYTMGVSTEGHLTYSGGGLTEVTGQLQQGTFRIVNAPRAFYLDAGFGKGGELSAVIYRQCVAPQTVLLLVVKDPQKVSEGADWLWVKSGKFAQ